MQFPALSYTDAGKPGAVRRAEKIAPLIWDYSKTGEAPCSASCLIALRQSSEASIVIACAFRRHEACGVTNSCGALRHPSPQYGLGDGRTIPGLCDQRN